MTSVSRWFSSQTMHFVANFNEPPTFVVVVAVLFRQWAAAPSLLEGLSHSALSVLLLSSPCAGKLLDRRRKMSSVSTSDG